MIINADFALKAVVHTQTMPWEKSPIEGVERKYLDRVGGFVIHTILLSLLIFK